MPKTNIFNSPIVVTLARYVERITVPLALIVAVCGLVYWYWSTTPSYALTQLAMSVKNHDVKMFEKYVDIDSVASRAVDDLLRGPAHQGLFGNFDSMIGAGIINFFKPEIVAIVHREVVKGVEGGSLDFRPDSKDIREIATRDGRYSALAALEHTASKTVPEAEFVEAEEVQSGGMFSLPKMPKSKKIKKVMHDYGISKEGFLGVDYLKNEGPNSYIGLKFHSPKYNRDYIVEFRMEDVGGYWRVTELSNLNGLVSQYLEERANREQHSSSLSF